MLDEFRIHCREWLDPDAHQVVKYVFKSECSTEPHVKESSLSVVEQTEKGNITTPLYSGPNREAIVVLPVGEFHLYAEIHEEAEAYAVSDINLKLPIYLPEQV